MNIVVQLRQASGVSMWPRLQGFLICGTIFLSLGKGWDCEWIGNTKSKSGPFLFPAKKTRQKWSAAAMCGFSERMERSPTHNAMDAMICREGNPVYPVWNKSRMRRCGGRLDAFPLHFFVHCLDCSFQDACVAATAVKAIHVRLAQFAVRAGSAVRKAASVTKVQQTGQHCPGVFQMSDLCCLHKNSPFQD